MARCRADGYHRTFEKSWQLRMEAEQGAKEREQQRQLPETVYTTFVNGDQVHQCSDWYEAHNIHTAIYAIDEWTGLPIYTAINGVPKWGMTPDLMADKATARRFKSNRTRYLNKTARAYESLEQRQQAALVKLAAIVEKVKADLAQIKQKAASWPVKKEGSR